MITAPVEFANEDDTLRWELLQRRVQRARATRGVKWMRSHGIEPILIKGVAAGLWYPADKVRSSTDVDLAFSASDFERAYRLISHSGADGLPIDLHRELRHLDSVSWADLFENSIEVSFDEGSVRVLRPEDHLRVLCVHWLTDGGAHKERLWDIYYAIENRPDSFDWARFLDQVSPRRRRWITCTVGITEKYLGLDLTNTPLAGISAELPNWLIRTVEQEWAAESKLLPLEVSLFNRPELLRQLKRRFRPDPIWSTIQAEGSFDARTRVFYQVAGFARRAGPSIRRMTRTIRERLK
ncbi:MAG TPA: nucleotidyltransferase family protein [Pyrinomonadaceae bacterium]|nr:nucleotidyltransferase family protein [Pyrinomonadaceae bacterium]